MRVARSAGTSTQVLFLVCETGHRWCDAARRFVGPFQHARELGSPGCGSTPNGPQFVVQSLEPGKVRAMIAGQSAVAILWEFSRDNAAATALNIAKIGAGRPDVFQVGAIGDLSGQQARSLSLQLTELGLAAILHSPEQLATTSRLIHRRFACD